MPTRPSPTPSSSASASARRTRRSTTRVRSRRTTAARSPRRRPRSRSRSAPTTRSRATGTRRAARSPGRWASSTRRRRTSRSRLTPRSVACTSTGTRARARTARRASTRRSARSGAIRRRPRPRIRAAYPTEDAGAQDRRLAQGAQRRRRGVLLRRRRASQGRGRYAEVPGLHGPWRQGDRHQAHPDQGEGLVREEEGGDREGRARVHQDPRAQARPAAEVGHRRRLSRRSDVGRLRRRLPPRADPDRMEDGRGAPRRLLRQPRRSERALQGSQREAGAQEVPRSVGQVPVLRRVLA